VAREVDFYNHLATRVPVRTPRCLFAGKLPALNVVCVALEHLAINAPGAAWPRLRVVPDHRFASADDLALLLRRCAALHAAFLGSVDSDPASRWIPAKRGLDFCEWVVTLGDKRKDGAPFHALFHALHRWFCKRPLTLVHGDCRPGNMVWLVLGEGQPAADVIMADWEATNAAPAAWDLCYATVIGLPAALRAKELPALCAAYHVALKAEAAKRGLNVPSPAELALELELLTLVLFYVSFRVSTAAFWKNQGNTRADLREWGDRVLAATRAVDARSAAHALGVEPALVVGLQRKAEQWAEQMR
jgi:hypothetical protein